MKAYLIEGPDGKDLWLTEDKVALRYIPANGLLYNPMTKQAFRFVHVDEAESTEWTFEDAQWYGLASPLNWIGGKLNPFSFATETTANKVLQLCIDAARVAGKDLRFVLVRSSAVGPFRRTDERSIFVESLDGERSEKFSAGLIAANCARRGTAIAMKDWIVELNRASL